MQEMARLDMIRCDYDAARQRLVKSQELLEAGGDQKGRCFCPL